MKNKEFVTVKDKKKLKEIVVLVTKVFKIEYASLKAIFLQKI